MTLFHPAELPFKLLVAEKLYKKYINWESAIWHNFGSCRGICSADRWKVSKQNLETWEIEMVGMDVEMKGREAEQEAQIKWQVSEQAREIGEESEKECRHRDKKRQQLFLLDMDHDKTKWNFPPALMQQPQFIALKPLPL